VKDGPMGKRRTEGERERGGAGTEVGPIFFLFGAKFRTPTRQRADCWVTTNSFLIPKKSEYPKL
jgi:hypothetical protein